MFSCTFIGHRNCPEKIRPIIYNAIEKLILTEKVSIFYVGTQGAFDYMVYQVLCELEKIYRIEVIVVLAYLNSTKSYYNMYKTIYPEGLEKSPRKYAISKRNQYMIENSQFMICYIENTYSNAYKFAEKAIKKGLKVLNIGRYVIVE